MFAAMNYGATGTFNIGTGKNYSILEMAELVAPGHPIEFIPPRKGEYAATLADITRAQNELGWKPDVSLKDGLYITDEFEKKARSPLIISVR
jgi:UDP-glucose 4-epimerase